MLDNIADLATVKFVIEIDDIGCSGIEVLDISVYGKAGLMSTNPDLFAVFSHVNSDGTTEFISYGSDWDEDGLTVPGTTVRGGVWAAPNCEQSSLLMTKNWCKFTK